MSHSNSFLFVKKKSPSHPYILEPTIVFVGTLFQWISYDGIEFPLVIELPAMSYMFTGRRSGKGRGGVENKNAMLINVSNRKLCSVYLGIVTNRIYWIDSLINNIGGLILL